MPMKCPLDVFIDPAKHSANSTAHRKRRNALKTKSKDLKKHLKKYSRSSFLNKNLGSLEKHLREGCVLGSTNCSKESEIITDFEKEVRNLGEIPVDQDICLIPESFHPYKGSQPEKLVVKSRPSVLQDQNGILMPKERREILHHEIEKGAAEKKLKTAESINRKRIDVIRCQYKNGILGFDSPVTGNSIYYKKDFQVLLKKKRKMQQLASARRKKLLQATNTKHLVDALNSPNKFQSLFDKKKKAFPSSEAYQTSSYEKLFVTDSRACWSSKKRVPEQTQKQQRGFDIISSSVVPW